MKRRYACSYYNDTNIIQSHTDTDLSYKYTWSREPVRGDAANYMTLRIVFPVRPPGAQLPLPSIMHNVGYTTVHLHIDKQTFFFTYKLMTAYAHVIRMLCVYKAQRVEWNEHGKSHNSVFKAYTFKVYARSRISSQSYSTRLQSVLRNAPMYYCCSVHNFVLLLFFLFFIFSIHNII